MTSLTINAAQLTQLSQLSTTSVAGGGGGRVYTYHLTATWQVGYCTNTSDATTFQASGPSGTSTVSSGIDIDTMYANLITQMQTDTGLTFIVNGGSAALFDTFVPPPITYVTPTATAPTTTVTGVQLVSPVAVFRDAGGAYHTLTTYVLVNSTATVSTPIMSATAPSSGTAPATVYSNAEAAVGTQAGQNFSGADTFSDPDSS